MNDIHPIHVVGFSAEPCNRDDCNGKCDPDSSAPSDHHMKGMFCVHCGRAFCIQDAPILEGRTDEKAERETKKKAENRFQDKEIE